ncbi:MAG: hypothetical protein EOP51_17380, partial [Sphingobacteriales bacterium]
MKTPLLLLLVLASLVTNSYSQTTGPGSRLNEVFKRVDLVPVASGLNDPWEITYGHDGMLWITEAKGYKVRRLDPNTGAGTIVLDLAIGATAFPSYNRVWTGTSGQPSPQGGLMGLALHPDWNATPAKKFVYLAYVKNYVGQNQTLNGEYVPGHLFKTWLVRFTYNTGTAQLESPVTICDTLTGSNDHNS